MHKIKASGWHLIVLIYFGRPGLRHIINKVLTVRTVDPEICLIFIFLKGLRLVFPSHFLYDFLRTLFLMLYFINWPCFNVWLPLLLQILSNMCLVIICCLVCDAIIFKLTFKILRAVIFKSSYKYTLLFNSGCLGVIAWKRSVNFIGKYLKHIPAKKSIADVFLWPLQSTAFNIQ